MRWNQRVRSAAALACVAGLFSLSGCTGSDQEELVTVTPTTDTVIEDTVEDTGTVAYRDNYSISPSVSGRILSCTIEEGDTVAEGDVLYTIDSGDLEDQITQAQLSLSNARASYDQAVAACEDLTVYASASGTVTTTYVHIGDYVNIGTPIADLVDSQNLELTVPFATEDAAALSPGASAVISFPSQAGTVTGSVKRIYDTPSVLSGGREGMYVVISFQNPGAIQAGATATATVGTHACMEAGTVTYGTQQSIYATQSGQVLTLSIQAGTSVTAGQTVMTIENASLTNAVTNAALSVQSASVNLSQLEAKRPDYSVTAPASGTIISRTSKTGDFASAAVALATLAQPDTLCVQVDVDEQSIDRIQPGQSARVSFTTDDGQSRTYEGTVNRVDDTGVTSGGVTDYTVELLLDSTDGLRAGMNVSATIVTQSQLFQLCIPSSAVTDGSVRILRDGKEETVAVETGLTLGGYTEILGGLSAEDTVILSGTAS